MNDTRPPRPLIHGACTSEDIDALVYVRHTLYSISVDQDEYTRERIEACREQLGDIIDRHYGK